MKSIPIAFLALLAIFLPARSEEQPATVTTARVLGDIPDGTPAPVTPIPEFIIPAKDILQTTTHELDGRTITIQRIKPIDLPEPPETVPVSHAAAPQRNLAASAQHPKQTTVSLSATVYRSASHPPRSLVTYRPNGNGAPVTFWSSADWALLQGITSFLATDGQAHMLFLMCSSENTDTSAAIRQAHGIPYQPPVIPTFPEGNATYQIVGNPPAAADLIPIQSLHDLYNREFSRLLTAHQGREQARLQHEADLKAHPPENQPQDITLNYWRTEKPAPATEGGAAQ